MKPAFQMIDVGTKPVTHRVAVASGEIVVGAEAFVLIRDRKLPKGDVLMLAEIAGIQGAKKACEMIPACGTNPPSIQAVFRSPSARRAATARHLPPASV